MNRAVLVGFADISADFVSSKVMRA